MAEETELREVSQAVERYFAQGWSCCQSVLLALGDHLKVRDDLLIAAAQGLGRGQGVVCGVLLAGLLTLGEKASEMKTAELQHPSRPSHEWLDVFYPSDNQWLREKAGQLQGQFRKRVEGRFPSLHCQDISGVDWAAPSAAMSRVGFPPPVCVELAKETARDVVALLGQGREPKDAP
ncbi:MAG: C_GCAxxG_C_C family protein [Chloroflexi bacterium]|nr:C_GCAxxG_C_C family protein [Chloroflexota bacterium]